MGSKFFSMNEFIKMAKLDWWLFTQTDELRWLNPNDRINCERIIAKLIKIKTLQNINLVKTF